MRVKRIIFSGASIVATLLLLEFFLRIVWSPPELNVDYQRRDTAWLQQNVVFNSHGYRDNEYAALKGEQTFRIYSLGDSYTFGWYIDDYRKTYPKFLEELLGDRLERKVEVINAARPGLSLGEEVKRFKTEGVFFLPDLVTIGLNYGEFDMSGSLSKPYRPSASFVWGSYLYQSTLNKFFQQIAFRKQYRYLMDIFQDSSSSDWQKFKEMILSLKSEASRINASLVIILFPHIDPRHPDREYQLGPMHERLAKFCQDEEVFLVDPLSLYLDHPEKKELVINPIDAHPSEIAHRLVAQSFFEQFDFVQYLADHQPYLPKSREVRLRSLEDSLGPYLRIKRIDSIVRDFPWVYFETKYENDVQEFTLKSLDERQSDAHVDRLITAKTFTHEGIIGGSLEYHLLAEDQKSGEIIIPTTIYGYPVVGVRSVQGFFLASLDHIEPLRLEKTGDLIKINFEPQREYEAFRLNLAVAVGQLDINPDGSIDRVTKTVFLRKVISQDGVDVLKFPVEGEVSGAPLFSTDLLSYYYAFVDNIFTRLKAVELTEEMIRVVFWEGLKAGNEVVLPVLAAWDITGKEVLMVEVE